MRLRRDPTAIQQLTTHPLVVMDVTSHRGNWKTMFPKSNPLYVELGTGKGQFIAKASTNYPNINWVGIDRIQEPLLHAVRQGEATENPNIRYLWTDIVLLQKAFASGEVERFHLHFSDPWPKTRHYKRRLTFRTFLGIYRELLSPTGDLILKTDSKSLYQFSLAELNATGWEVLEQSEDFHHSEWAENNITTEYEDKFAAKGMPIYYLRVQLQKLKINSYI